MRTTEGSQTRNTSTFVSVRTGRVIEQQQTTPSLKGSKQVFFLVSMTCLSWATRQTIPYSSILCSHRTQLTATSLRNAGRGSSRENRGVVKDAVAFKEFHLEATRDFSHFTAQSMSNSLAYFKGPENTFLPFTQKKKNKDICTEP